MARPTVFKKNDVKRAIEVARDVGLDIGGIEICDGSIRIIIAKDSAVSRGEAELDKWMKNRAR